jgi:predicted AlkP superfamily phosphohydrolase/phosphomutase
MPQVRGLRRSKPFWNVLAERGIFSAVLRVPITFPPDRFRGVQLSAMCVPDLRGTHGTFSYYTDHDLARATQDGEVGGDVIRVERDGDTVRSFLRGPRDPLRRDQIDLRAPFRVKRLENGCAVLRICGRAVRLRRNEYSAWVRITFRAGGIVKLRGLCRFLLRRFDEEFELYASPIQIDPGRPVMAISHPRRYSVYLSRLIGDFATAGLAEDTWALSEKRLDEEAFLQQSYAIHEEREKMYFDAIARVRRGLVACVFDGPDRIQHMFWRFIDPHHPAADDAGRELHGHVVRDMYRRMDDLVGRTMAALDDRTALLVMSDHGFKPFRRCVDLNAWLREHGYLHVKPDAPVPSGAYLADIDWQQTRAYALGLAGIYLNLKGREGEGIVERGDGPALAKELCDRLTGLRDPQSGEAAIHEAMPRGAVYSGPYVDAAPDIVIGYNVGYRVSWDSVIGKCGPTVFCDNTKAWSGDHCIHPALVPGILASNRPLNTKNAEIIDIAPTVLELLGVDKPAYMDGKSLVCAAERS